ncbi:hypothetical protein, partial [Lysinibacillus sp. NPDC047702]
MENSKLYSTQDIAKLKEKIETYRETLTSLKMGTSIEDYLFMKKEFDGLKTQIAHLEGLTETLDDRQNSQIKGYEEQIKQLSTQIELLNRTIEEMNQEILIVLKKLLTMEVNEAPAPTTTPSIEKHSPLISNVVQRQPRIAMAQDQSTSTSKQPSYRLLQNLAGKATNKQLDLNHNILSSGAEHQRNIPEERHFNQHYFQSVNTHPGQIYNGLYRNTNTESTFHFKNASDTKQIPVSIYDSTTINSSIIDETKPEIINQPVVLETPEVMTASETLKASQEVNESVTLERPNVINEEPVILYPSQTRNEPVVVNSPETMKEKPLVLYSSEAENKEPIVCDSSETVNKETVVLDSSETVNKETVVLDSSETVNKETVVLD